MTDKPHWLTRDPGDVLVAATQTSGEARRKARETARKNAEERAKFTADTQPRDSQGRFRKILARLKLNLGSDGTEDLAKEIESVEQAQIAGNYAQMKAHSQNLTDLVENLDSSRVPGGVAKNLRRGATDLAKVLAYLPLPQGNPNAKVRFSDVPPASKQLIRDMVKRANEKLGEDDAEEYTKELEEFMSGARTMTSDQMSENLNRVLRVLV